MPISEVHKQRKAKNIALLAVIIFVIMLFFMLTVIKFKSPNVDMLGQVETSTISETESKNASE